MLIKKSADRGYHKNEWLESFHSFSFASYFNPQAMHYSHLRVINEDKVQPNTGFGFHPHKDMEIITFMLDGKIQHKDNMGNIGNLSKGNAQLMRAGTGIVHSEMNPFTDTAHLLQIWINSDEKSLKPGWWEKDFTGNNALEVIVEPIRKTHQLVLLSPKLAGNGLQMARNGYILKISANATLDFANFGLSEVYLHQATGASTIDYQGSETVLEHGDAAMGEANKEMKIKAKDNSILLVLVFPK